MSDKEERRQRFLKNYTGIFKGSKYFDYLEECVEIDRTYANATYSELANKQMARQAKEQAFNRHMRK